MKILIVDDHAIVREGYANILSNMLDNCSILEASDGSQALELYQQHKPALTILDINLNGISGTEVARRILQRDQQANILFFSMHDDTPVVRHALDTGAQGYITKNCSPDILLQAVNEILQGKSYVEHELSMRLALSRPGQRDQRLKSLSDREFEIFNMLAQGIRSQEIAERLFISPKTVANHYTNLKQKLNISSSAEIVHFAIETGVIKLSQNNDL